MSTSERISPSFLGHGCVTYLKVQRKSIDARPSISETLEEYHHLKRKKDQMEREPFRKTETKQMARMVFLVSLEGSKVPDVIQQSLRGLCNLMGVARVLSF